MGFVDWINNEDTFRAIVYLTSYLLLVVLIGVYSAIKNVKRVANNDKINPSNFATKVLAHCPSTQITANPSEAHAVPSMITMDILTSKNRTHDNDKQNAQRSNLNVNQNQAQAIEKSITHTNSSINITIINPSNPEHNNNNNNHHNLHNLDSYNVHSSSDIIGKKNTLSVEKVASLPHHIHRHHSFTASLDYATSNENTPEPSQEHDHDHSPKTGYQSGQSLPDSPPDSPPQSPPQSPHQSPPLTPQNKSHDPDHSHQKIGGTGTGHSLNISVNNVIISHHAKIHDKNSDIDSDNNNNNNNSNNSTNNNNEHQNDHHVRRTHMHRHHSVSNTGSKNGYGNGYHDYKKHKSSAGSVTSVTSVGSIRERGISGDDVTLTCKECLQLFFTFRFCKTWLRDIFVQRGIYATVLVYAFDIVTDMNVMIFWFKEAIIHQHKGVLTYALLALTILLLYRIVSSYSIYKATSHHINKRKRILFPILQFVDFYIFYEVFKSHQGGKKSVTLLWINSMEAVLESAPQIIVQGTYLLTYKNAHANDLVLLGLFFSVSKLGATVIARDKLSVVRKARHWYSGIKYYIRFLFRIFELSSRIFVYLLIWVIIGGYVLTGIIFSHFLHNLILYFGGCLGREIFNLFGYFMFIPKLNKTLQEGKQYSYFSNNCYINFYQKCEFMQTRMMIIRFFELIIYEIIIGVYATKNSGFSGRNRTSINNNYHQSYHKEQFLQFMYYSGLVMTFLAPLFWYLMIKLKIFDFNAKEEQIAFRSIFKAIKLGRIERIKTDFNTKEHVINVNPKSKSKETPLHYACLKNAFEILSWIINESGFIEEQHINALDVNEQTPLFIACKYGSYQCVDTLIKSDFSINIRMSNVMNQSILHTSCKYGKSKIVDYLLNKLSSQIGVGLDSSMLNQQTSDSGDTALHNACSRGHTECVVLLLKENQLNINILNYENHAPVHLAILNAFNDIAIKLIHDTRFRLSLISLHKLWFYSIKMNNVLIVQALLDNQNAENLSGMDVDPKHLGKEMDDIKTAQQPLLDIRKADKFSNEIPLVIASKNNCGDMIELLTSMDNSIVNECDSRGFTPLYIACIKGHVDAALSLLECGNANIFAQTEYEQNTILMGVCQGGSLAIFDRIAHDILKRFGKDKLKSELNKVNVNQKTALYFACRYDSHKIVQKMQQKSFDGIVDFDGYCDLADKKTPSVVANDCKSVKTIEVFNLV